eukprot:TRINITY_DN62299_c0_g2_i1.p1 TRINITY_DN62299_c0_g2~~TRINITY_DN62299_c0_g2_i1.p1  ORF type:complete len:420 (-),score=86.88 TRINITY_DN62299_c0_g2_i1:299-1558(-)
MEAALQHVLHSTLGEYVSGLENAGAGFPLQLNNLKLKEKKVQEELDDTGDCPFDVNDGVIGSVTITPGWMGGVEIRATNIVLNLSFNAMKAMKRAMRPDEPEQYYETMVDRDVPPGVGMGGMPPPPQMAPQVPVAPRFCCNHDTSEKRVKTEPCFKECKSCGVRLQTSYADFMLCPPCSDGQRRCMICGSGAQTASSYVPPTTLNTKDGPPPEPRRPGCADGMPHPPPPVKNLPPHLRELEEDRARRGGHRMEEPLWGGGGAAPSRNRDMPPPPPGAFNANGGGMPPSPGGHGGYGPGPAGNSGYGRGPPPPGHGGPPRPGGFPNNGFPNNGFGGPGGFPPHGGPQGPPPGQGGGLPPQQQGGPPANLAGGANGFELPDIGSAFRDIFDFNKWTKTCNADSRVESGRMPPAGQRYAMAH